MKRYSQYPHQDTHRMINYTHPPQQRKKPLQQNAFARHSSTFTN